LDLLDVRFTPSGGFDASDIPGGLELRNASGLFAGAASLAGFGLLLLLASTAVEWTRRKKAKRLAMKMFGTQSKWQ
jgi:hypothetical protein